ncbi:unnamed protein product [Closterium sp. NIES-53]
MACITTPLFFTGRWLPNWADDVGGCPHEASVSCRPLLLYWLLLCLVSVCPPPAAPVGPSPLPYFSLRALLLLSLLSPLLSPTDLPSHVPASPSLSPVSPSEVIYDFSISLILLKTLFVAFLPAAMKKLSGVPPLLAVIAALIAVRCVAEDFGVEFNIEHSMSLHRGPPCRADGYWRGSFVPTPSGFHALRFRRLIPCHTIHSSRSFSQRSPSCCLLPTLSPSIPSFEPSAFPPLSPVSNLPPFPLYPQFRTFRLPPSIFRRRTLRVSLPFPPPQAWELAYDLAEGTIRPPAKISLPPNVPPPPHLEDCAARTAFRESTEKRAANGESPKWSNSSEACGWVPQPPWVRGPDAGNLAGTRKAQRDLWELQFPASCKERKLLLVEWPPVKGYGLGSQLHIITSLFSFAVNSNRTLVIKPGSYVRANHSECQGGWVGGRLRGWVGG